MYLISIPLLRLATLLKVFDPFGILIFKCEVVTSLMSISLAKLALAVSFGTPFI